MIENAIERLLFASRWLLAPVYLGLSLALVALGVRFFIEVFHVLGGIVSMSESDKLFWYVVIHLTFVVSAVMLGVLDRMPCAAHRKH